MASQQVDQGSQGSLAIAPALIVGIVIAAAFATMIIVASICGYCRRSQSNSVDNETGTTGAEIFNPNRPRTAAQSARMKEVRWINNMYAWERGRLAKLETGEIRRATMLLGRQPGQSRSWDEWSIEEQTSSRRSLSKNPGDCAHLFYNVDNPYAPSQPRSSHLALPRYSSVLLPQPIQRGMIQSSPLRHEYQDKGDAEPRKQMAHAGLEAKTLGFSQARNQSIRNLTPKLEPFTPDEPYPQPPASPLSPGSVIYHDNEGMNGQDLMNTTKSQTTDSNSSHDGVKSMIQEWEKVNGRFARIASINAPGTHQEFSYDEG